MYSETIFAGMTGSSIQIRYAQAELRLTDGIEIRRWPACVAFGPVARPLLGFAGCLQFFDATFLGADHEMIILPNRTFTGRRI